MVIYEMAAYVYTLFYGRLYVFLPLFEAIHLLQSTVAGQCSGYGSR